MREDILPAITGLLQNHQEGQWWVLLMIFIAVFVLVIAIMALFNDYFDPVRVRLKSIGSHDEVILLEMDQVSEQLRKHQLIYVPTDKYLLKRTANRLHYAGYHTRDSLMYYYSIKTLMTVGLPLLVFIVMSIIPAIKAQDLVLWMSGALAIGYISPSFVLDKLITARQKTLKRSFPDALDLIVICSEAGLGLDAALQKVSEELVISHPELAAELNLVIAETRAGVERHIALQRIVDRTGVEDIRGLVSTLTQSMRFGTSIAEALRYFSEELRDKRLQAAEEAAAKIALKLIFPLGLCLLPAFLMVVLVPMMLIFKSL